MSHWYIQKNGSACRYEQLKKDGTPSKVVKRSKAIEDGACLGVTDIIRYAGKSEGLTNWIAAKGIEAGLFAGKIPDPELAEKAAWGRYEELRNTASDKGSDMHSSIDGFLKHGNLPVDNVCRVAAISVANFLKSMNEDGKNTEVCLCGSVGDMRYGGTSDHISHTLIADWKTTKRQRSPYLHECAQLMAYQALCGYTDAKLMNVYISQDTGEIYGTRTYSEQDKKDGWSFFVMAYRIMELQVKWGEG